MRTGHLELIAKASEGVAVVAAVEIGLKLPPQPLRGFQMRGMYISAEQPIIVCMTGQNLLQACLKHSLPIRLRSEVHSVLVEQQAYKMQPTSRINQLQHRIQNRPLPRFLFDRGVWWT